MYRLLFHKDVFMPEGVRDVVRVLQRQMKNHTLSAHFREHLQQHAYEDRSHKYLEDIVDECLKDINSQAQNPFEVELSKGYYEFGVNGWVVTKYCVRVPYDCDADLVIVIRPGWNKEKHDYDANINIVVTAWLNESSDSHRTLDESKYCSEDAWKSERK